VNARVTIKKGLRLDQVKELEQSLMKKQSSCVGHQVYGDISTGYFYEAYDSLFDLTKKLLYTVYIVRTAYNPEAYMMVVTEVTD
jgi:hypothetical protein